MAKIKSLSKYLRQRAARACAAADAVRLEDEADAAHIKKWDEAEAATMVDTAYGCSDQPERVIRDALDILRPPDNDNRFGHFMNSELRELISAEGYKEVKTHMMTKAKTREQAVLNALSIVAREDAEARVALTVR